MQGFIPSVLYGHKVKNQNLSLKYSDFEKVLDQAGESTLIDLTIDNQKSVKVLIHDFDRDAVTHKVNHVDLYQVNMKEKIKTEIELVFVNESPAVKDLSAILIKALDKIEIECLPGDLISHVEIDLSSLKEFGDVIRVKDLSLPENITLLTESEAAVALVEEPREEEEIKEEEETEGVEEVEVEGEKKEEGAEGETAEKKQSEDKKGDKTEEKSTEEKTPEQK